MTKEYQVALSFAGEDRAYVETVANGLKQNGITVFYDKFEEEDLWGKDLYAHLTDVYMNKAEYCVMFISESYGKKLWTSHERKAMQARAFQEHQEYILPAKFDNSEIPGVLPTTGYIDLRNRTPDQLVDIIIKKIKKKGSAP